ncbi:hypothetical protein U3516DRAFT_763621 [Neocallimastix sp. 'constans']
MKFFSINHGRNINTFHSNALQKKKISFTINNLENIVMKGKEEDNKTFILQREIFIKLEDKKYRDQDQDQWLRSKQRLRDMAHGNFWKKKAHLNGTEASKQENETKRNENENVMIKNIKIFNIKRH